MTGESQVLRLRPRAEKRVLRQVARALQAATMHSLVEAVEVASGAAEASTEGVEGVTKATEKPDHQLKEDRTLKDRVLDEPASRAEAVVAAKGEGEADVVGEVEDRRGRQAELVYLQLKVQVEHPRRHLHPQPLLRLPQHPHLRLRLARKPVRAFELCRCPCCASS